MKARALIAALLLFPLAGQASVVKVISPDTAQTYSYSSMTWRSLRWNAARRRLQADITFSTYNYVTQGFPLREESYVFDLPGVRLDPKQGVFYVRMADGARVDVARYSRGLIGESIEPIAGTVIYVFKRHGKVLVALTGTDRPTRDDPFKLHWVERNNGFFLDNLVKTGIAEL